MLEKYIEYLVKTYLKYGPQKLYLAINQRSKNQNTAIYIATDSFNEKIAGNLNSWPDEKVDTDGFISFEISRALGSEIITHNCRAKIITFKNGSKLLVGRDIQPEVLISKALTNLIIFTIKFSHHDLTICVPSRKIPNYVFFPTVVINLLIFIYIKF